jgi:acetyl esterase/lipase
LRPAAAISFRLAREAGSTYKVDDAVHDAELAIRVVRSRAAEWNVDAARVGIIGFSAGGEIAVRAATAVAEMQDGGDAVDRLSARPDFEALIYPGVNAGSLQITKDTPPTFLLCADNDKGPSVTVGELYLALKKAGLPAEMHVYASGGHGFEIRENPKPVPIQVSWYLRLGDWLKDRGLVR